MKLIGIFAVLVVISFIEVDEPAQPTNDKRTFDERKMVYCAPSFDPSRLGGKAPLLEGLGSTSYKITTKSAMAQKYFNQGLALTYGFNHSEAARSFKTALSFDSTVAMGYWGLAMVLGPNYNVALNPTSLTDINNAVANALKYSVTVKPREKALIQAIAKRFPKEETKDMTPYYEAYAQAMKEAHQSFPQDMDIATIYADALMNLHPWNLWLKDGIAQPWTAEIIQLLEKILRASPEHPGAIHYYIHATEASKEAHKALPYADKLGDAMPAAGHLVHMPSHTYIRTGHYHKGVIVNEKASVSDSLYIAQCKVQGVYPLFYYPHNIHFLATCAFFEGSSQKALDAAWMLSRKADRNYLAEIPTVQHYYVIPYYVMVHLGKWDDILALNHPGKELKYATGIWHYARGMALAAKKNFSDAQKELEQLQKIAANDSLKEMKIWDMNNMQDLAKIAAYNLEGELLGHTKKYDEAINLFYKAIAIEDKLAYTEPPDWFFSIRHTLGHWLIQAGRFAEAEKVYREDLETFKENGWALIGLYNSLQGQKRLSEAAEVKKRFEKAWQWADMKITSSRAY